jgi:hypothetical protein
VETCRKEIIMTRRRLWNVVPGAGCLALLLSAIFATPEAQQADRVAIDPDDIGGVVSGPNGPEAGVWVIAETRDLPVRYIKSVVTDDRGRYVVPDLPKARYSVWARGYGLVDSAKSVAEPGRLVNLTAVPAPNDAAAAEYYPAIYWYSMMKIPPASEFGGGSSIPKNVTQADYLSMVKSNGCIGCHQLGQKSTRTIPPGLGTFASSEQAWARRIQSGQSGEQMINQAANQMGGAPIRNMAEWTDRIAKGELPHTKPTRPQGVERNIVVTLRDWMNEQDYLHDLIASDRRYPTVNAYGPVYGSPEYSSDDIPVLDIASNTATTFKAPVKDPSMPVSLGPGHAASLKPLQSSPYWGDEVIWDSRANNHNSMFDKAGRLWLAATVRGVNTPDYCRKGSDHPSAKLFPIERSNRQIAVYDPKTKKYTFVDTCYGTHHPQFGYDANDTLWTSGGGPVVGWLNTRMFLETGDDVKSQGWAPMILDINGNGKQDAWVEPDQPVDPTKDKRVNAGFYAVMPNPVDGSVWGTFRGAKSGVVRVNPGSNPPSTTLTEVYDVPMPGFGVRGGDIDKKGVLWVSLASGHIGSFDRSKCKGPLNGPKATGDHCPEGWRF